MDVPQTVWFIAENPKYPKWMMTEVSHELETSISKYIPHRQDIQQSLHQAKGILCT